jgi:hypothetical protein
MAHFAELDKKGYVLRVIVINNSDILDENGNESEEKGIIFCKELYGFGTRWVQTSYNAKFRQYYAGIGFKYDSKRDVFVPSNPGIEHLMYDKEKNMWVPDPSYFDPELLKIGIPNSMLA